MSNCLVGQSGGPTVAINATLCGVIKAAKNAKQINKIYGAVNGIQGIFNDNLCDLNEIFVNEKDLELLKKTPSSYLGSCRYRLPKEFDKDYEQIFEYFKKHDIGYFFYIGGNDSMDTVHKVSLYAKYINFPINIIGIPKTIDNDLFGTDHTPGYGSAAKYVASTILEITHDSNVYNAPSVTIIEIMGRNAGWLTAASSLAGTGTLKTPHLIYLPEKPFSAEKFIEDIKVKQQENKRVIIAVSEGIKDYNGRYVCESMSSGATDIFGHKYMGGCGKVLENIVHESLKCKVRSIELNVMQRCASHIASLTDINESEYIGKEAVKAALNNETGKMMVLMRENSNSYSVKAENIDVSLSANKEKNVPDYMINNEGNYVTQSYIDYALPLIQGELKIDYINGIPHYINL